MKYFFIFFTIFSFNLFSLEQIKNEEKDNRPGSRTIYVKNHSQNSQILLEVTLRECTCGLSKTNICSCWNDSRDEDQPFIQGPGSNLFNILPFEIFICEKVNQEKEWEFLIPSPKKLIEICEKLNFAYFKLVPGNKPVSTHDYLLMLAEGKIPLGDIPLDSEMKDIFMLYHPYFHDFINHFFTWVALNSYVRKLVAKRASSLLNTFDDFKKTFKDDPLILSIIQIIKFHSVLFFDTSMGSFNNKLLANKFSLPDGKEKKKIENYYQQFVNFGINLDDYRTCDSIKVFTCKWFFLNVQHLENHFLEITKDSPYELKSLDVIKKDKRTYNAYNLLKQENIKNLEKAFNEIKHEIFELAPYGGDHNEDQKLPAIEDLYREMEQFYNNLSTHILNIYKDNEEINKTY